jgi:hypothetical protein
MIKMMISMISMMNIFRNLVILMVIADKNQNLINIVNEYPKNRNIKIHFSNMNWTANKNDIRLFF